MMKFPRIVPTVLFNPVHKQNRAKGMEGRT
ncbi:hypothetical protein FBY03_11696 [Pseudomonas sp. SJZ079]|nr:hypothetical protein FBY03_11696 [Pseudomonas sp. SJZ079]